MAHTLGQAAKAAGVSKTTLRRAIENGRLSASRNADGSYEIDPAELHRAFPSHSDGSGTMARSVTVNGTGVTGRSGDVARAPDREGRRYP